MQLLSGMGDVCHVVRSQGVGCSSALSSVQSVGSFAWVMTETMWETGIATACGTFESAHESGERDGCEKVCFLLDSAAVHRTEDFPSACVGSSQSTFLFGEHRLLCVVPSLK